MAGQTEYIDLRRVGREGLAQIRRQVVRLKKMGRSGREIEEIVGIRQNRISEIWSAYQQLGEASFLAKSAARPGKPALLPPQAQRELREIFMTKTPQELGLRGQVWTQGQAAEFVRRTYRIELAPRTMSAYLARWRAQSRRPRGRLTVEEKNAKKPLL